MENNEIKIVEIALSYVEKDIHNLKKTPFDVQINGRQVILDTPVVQAVQKFIMHKLEEKKAGLEFRIHTLKLASNGVQQN